MHVCTLIDTPPHTYIHLYVPQIAINSDRTERFGVASPKTNQKHPSQIRLSYSAHILIAYHFNRTPTRSTTVLYTRHITHTYARSTVVYCKMCARNGFKREPIFIEQFSILFFIWLIYASQIHDYFKDCRLLLNCEVARVK